MKRSEIINIIAQHLREEYGPKIVEDIGDITCAIAVTILDLIEDTGMLPPFSNEIFLKNWIIFRETSPSGNEWESE